MRRRYTVIGITAVTLAGGLAIAAALAPGATVSAGGSVNATANVTGPANMVTGPVGRYAPNVLGTFEEMGGPAPSGPTAGQATRPLHGVVTFKDGDGHTTDVTVGPSGQIIARVPAGTYTVSGQTPQIEQENADGTISDPPCAGPQAVIVRPNHQALLALVCYVP
jgi:hypothetical protein